MVVDEYPCTADHRVFTAGLNMTGRHQRFENLPLVYSDQYDRGLEYTGYAPPDCYHQVVFRGDVAQREFVAFWPDRGRVVAGMNVNTWGVRDARRGIESWQHRHSRQQ
jgi:3-phenylpropionate/trans-cinnamate dioxygenase ferredoxin reductase subunit